MFKLDEIVILNTSIALESNQFLITTFFADLSDEINKDKVNIYKCAAIKNFDNIPSKNRRYPS